MNPIPNPREARFSVLIVLCALSAAPARAQQQPPAAQPPAAPPPAGAPAAAPADDGDAPRIDFTGALREGQNPMTADQAAAQTIKTAPSVRRAQAQARKAQEVASEAVVLAWPRLDLEARYTHVSGSVGEEFQSVLTEEPMGGVEPPMGFDPADFEVPLDQVMFQARLAVPLSDIFLTILPRYRAAKHAAEAQALNAKAESATVALLGREAFYNYARTRASLLVVRSSLEQSEAQRRDVNALVSAGTLARVESMRADAQVAAAKVALSRAEGLVAVARVAFRTLLHMPGNAEVALIDDWSQPLPPLRETQEQLYQTALKQRAELQALRTLTEAQDETLAATSAEQWPKLGIGGSAEYARPNQSVTLFGNKFQPSWQVFAALTWSPSDLATGSARHGQTEADRQSTLADMEIMQDGLRREVAQGYEDYQAAGNSMDSAVTGIRAAEEAYRVRREQFRAGAAVAIDVIQAEAELRQARLELINAAIDVRIARARLDRAVGRDQ